MVAAAQYRRMNEGKRYILAAEDDNDDQLLMESAFSELDAPYDLIFVENGMELIAFLENASSLPELLILDLNMPKMSGLEALDVLHGKPYFQTFKTVVFSTTYSEGEQLRLQQRGVYSCFTKPLTYASLLEITATFVQLVAGRVN